MTETTETVEVEIKEEKKSNIVRRWYVVHTYSGHENKVKENLFNRIESMDMQDKIFQIEVPEENVVEIRGGKRVKKPKKVFPGYVLVEMILDEESWHVVRNTPGVSCFVGAGNKPIPLMEKDIRNILFNFLLNT